jgi:hypothetical protein
LRIKRLNRENKKKDKENTIKDKETVRKEVEEWMCTLEGDFRMPALKEINEYYGLYNEVLPGGGDRFLNGEAYESLFDQLHKENISLYDELCSV